MLSHNLRLLPLARPSSFEQSQHPPVRERLATGLTGGAVLQGRLRERDLAHDIAADRTRMARASMPPLPCALTLLELLGRLARRGTDRAGQRIAQRGIQPLDLLLIQARSQRKR